jgi:hypothetical protein
MTGIKTRDEALASVDGALAQWETNATGVLAQAVSVVEAARGDAERLVRRWTTKVAALRPLLDSLGPNDDPRPIESALARAEVSLRAAESARHQVIRVAEQVAVLGRSFAQRTSAEVAAGRADLARRTVDLDAYRSRGGGAAGGGGAPAAEDKIGAALSPLGLAKLDVGAADFSDNPISGGFGRGGTTRADYRWAVQTWDETVGPGVARGMTRADFEARDAARGAPVLRRTAAVYDMFLGDSDRILVSRRPDGSLDVTNGRHRMEVARELGVNYLPGQVLG